MTLEQFLHFNHTIFKNDYDFGVKMKKINKLRNYKY